MRPTWSNVLQHLPAEYTSDLDLFDPNIQEDTPNLEEKTQNFFLIHRDALFSNQGYAGTMYSDSYRTWMRWHYDNKGQVDGVLFTHVSSERFHAWISPTLVQDEEKYSMYWPKNTKNTTTFSIRLGDRPQEFSPILKRYLQNHQKDPSPPSHIHFVGQHLTAEQENNLQQIFQNCKPGLPPSLKPRFAPPSSKWPYVVGGGAALVAIGFFLYHFWAKVPPPPEEVR